MSDAQKEQLTALLDDIYSDFKATISESVGKSQDDVIPSLQTCHLLH